MTTFGMKIRTQIGFKNIRTLWEARKLAQCKNEMDLNRLEILGLSEVRWTGFREEHRLDDGKSLLYSGREEGEEHSSGVGFLLTRRARRSLVEWNPVSDRIITVRFGSRVHCVYVVHLQSRRK